MSGNITRLIKSQKIDKHIIRKYENIETKVLCVRSLSLLYSYKILVQYQLTTLDFEIEFLTLSFIFSWFFFFFFFYQIYL